MPLLSMAWLRLLIRLRLPWAPRATTLLPAPTSVVTVWVVLVLLWPPAPSNEASGEAPRAALTLEAVRVSSELERRVTVPPLTWKGVLPDPSRSHTSGSLLPLPRLVEASITPIPADTEGERELAPP